MRYLVLTLFVVMAGLLPQSSKSQTWQLVWSDEFDVAGLPDTSKWSYDVGGGGWGNQESQYYTDSRTENARVENGNLVIEARKENFGGNSYTSARLVSKGKGDWTFGRIEARAQLPSGIGTWPAIWMLYSEGFYGGGGWPDNGEIDIMEHVGFDEDQVHGTIHTDAYNHTIGTQRGGNIFVSESTSQMHVYSIEWSPAKIDFFVDGTRYFTFPNDNVGWETWPFDRDFHLILNLAIGGTWGGQQGIDDSIFPQQMLIDYVRVYEYEGVPSVELTNPQDSIGLQVGEELNIAASATDPDGVIDRVVFYQRDGVLAVDTEEPFGLQTRPLAEGCYEIRAVAVDNIGWQATSSTIPVNVGSSCGQAPYLMSEALIPGQIEAEHFDLGGSGVGYQDLDTDNTGNTIRLLEGVDIEGTADDGGGHNIESIARREWLEYSVDVQQSGIYSIDLRVASASTEGSLQIDFDSVDKTGPIIFPATGGPQTWSTVTKAGVQLDAGKYKMRINFLGSSFKLNWVRFTFLSGTAIDAQVPGSKSVLGEVYPNPAAQDATVGYTLDQDDHVQLKIVDVLGREVAELVDMRLAPGSYTASISTADLAPALYFVVMQMDDQTATMPFTVSR